MTEQDRDVNPMERALFYVENKNAKEAVKLYEKIVQNEMDGADIAAFNLGHFYSGDFGLERNYELAKEYYEISEKLGHEKASYSLAHLFLRLGDTLSALNRFRRLALNNPSAAYWAYRIIEEHAQLSDDPFEAEHYLSLAIDGGHLHAKKIKIIRKIKGRMGFISIFTGLFDYIKLFFDAHAAVKNGKKNLYE